MHEIGKTEDNPDAKGLAFLIQQKLKSVLLILIHIYRVIKMKISLQGKKIQLQ